MVYKIFFGATTRKIIMEIDARVDTDHTNRLPTGLKNITRTEVEAKSGIDSSIIKSIPIDIVPTVSNDLQISLGMVTGTSIVVVTGSNSDIDTGSTPEDIWNGSSGGGIYTGFPLGAAEQVTAISTDAADTSDGTGARTITVYGLDSSYNQISEVITLNGLTVSSPTTQSFLRLNRAVVTTSGSGGVNAGTITIKHLTTTTNIFSVIPIGLNESTVLAYTIPLGFTGYLVSDYVAVVGQTAGVFVVGTSWKREFGKPAVMTRPFTAYFGYAYQEYHYGGIPLPEKTDLTVRITESSNTNVKVIGSMHIVLVAN